MTNRRVALNDFFISVQIKAFRQAEFALGNRDEALDLVQDAMMRLAQKYSDQQDNWPKLFQRILQNLIKDWYRKQKVRKVLYWFQQDSHLDELPEIEDLARLENKPDGGPERQQQQVQINQKVADGLRKLPTRQQQAFLLRAWWEYDTEETAFAMSCSTGSVKTHYSRAVSKLRELLGDIDF